MELHGFVLNVALQQLNASQFLYCSQLLGTCSYQQRGFLRFGMTKLNFVNSTVLKSLFFSFPTPDELLPLDSFLLPDLKAPPVQSIDVQPMTCTGFLVFPQEVRVVLLECTAKPTISAHFLLLHSTVIPVHRGSNKASNRMFLFVLKT